MAQAAARKVEAWMQSHPLDRLPFMVPNPGEGRIMWAPRPTGDYGFDCTLGAEYAEAVLSLMRDPSLNDPGLGRGLLRMIVLGILRHGDEQRDRGVIVGMMSRLGDVLACGVGRAAP